MKKIKNIMLGLFLVVGCFLLSSVPAKAKLHESVLVEEKTYSEDVPTPSNPVEGTEYIFAGWFTDQSCTSALETKTVGTSAYAKFVPADVMSVKAQVLAGTMYSSKKSNIRFVTTVDSLDYQTAGFEFVINGSTRVSDPITTVYRQLCGIGNTGEVLEYNPKTEFHAASEYFYTWTVRNVPNAAFGEGIQARPYLVTLDGTKVYGEWATKAVNMEYIPDVIGSDVGYLYDITAPTLDAYPSGGYLQGGCTDGTYYYQAFLYGDNEATIVCKYDKEGNLIKQSDVLTTLGHAGDITYNKKLNQLVVCHYRGTSGDTISFLDTENLAVQTTMATGYNTGGISYNALTDNYVIWHNLGSGDLRFSTVTSDFSEKNTYEFDDATDTFTPQGVASDDSYIYFLYFHNSSTVSSYEGHVIAVYDWDGNYVGIIEISVEDIPLTYESGNKSEPENISVIDNEMYISCADGYGKAKFYKVDNLETKYEAIIGSVYYETLENAVAAAHEDTESEAVEVTVLKDVQLTITDSAVPLQIRRNIVLKNLPGQNVVITGDSPSPQLIRVYNTDGVTCSLEIGGTEDGSITIDGTGRTTGASLIRNDKGCTFTLGANAAVVNGGATSSTGVGAGLNNFGTANLYGDFKDNKAANGGAIYNNSTGVVNIYAGTYSGNKATSADNATGGGAIYSEGTLKIANAEFNENTAGSRGGAIYHITGQLQVDGCTFKDNSTTKRQGGAMYVASVETIENTPSYIQNTSFYKNIGCTTSGTNGNGGAIAFEKATLNITDCQFGGTNKDGSSLGNTTHKCGGAIFQTGGGTITITSTTGKHSFENNTASGHTDAAGGALYSNTGTIKVIGYIFKNNTVAGASNNYSVTSGTGNVVLSNCTEE